MSIKKIINEGQKGWVHEDIPWRKTAVECGVDPNKFLTLENLKKEILRIIKLPKQSQILFFNTIYRKYEFLRITPVLKE